MDGLINFMFIRAKGLVAGREKMPEQSSAMANAKCFFIYKNHFHKNWNKTKQLKSTANCIRFTVQMQLVQIKIQK